MKLHLTRDGGEIILSLADALPPLETHCMSQSSGLGILTAIYGSLSSISIISFLRYIESASSYRDRHVLGTPIILILASTHCPRSVL